jgi:hypothetical protein
MWWGFVYVTFVIDVFAAGSSVGEQATRQAPASSWMLWSKPFINAGLPKTNWFTIWIADPNIY